MKKIITLEWELHDTRDLNGGYWTGTSKLELKTNNYIKLLNASISFADNIPSWELERNNIDIEQYKDEKYARYHYTTKLSKILKIENAM